MDILTIVPKNSLIDSKDIEIMRCMQENARLTTKELALKVHLSPTPVYERLKRLEREGYIKKYVAILDTEKLNLGFVVFCTVKLKVMNKQNATVFEAAVKEMAQVSECYNISGEFDYMLKVYSPDMYSYKEFIMNVLGNIDQVGSIQSIFVMNNVKNDNM